MKFNRTYRLTIDMQDGGDLIVITPPLTLQFSCQRGYGASINMANIGIYNLGKETRDRIFKDKFTIGKYQQITLEVGYDNELSTVFKGNLFQASSERRGTDIITKIIARDGGFDITGTKSFKTISTGANLSDIFETLIGDFPNLTQGSIGYDDFKFNRPVVLNGNTYDLLRKYSNNSVFVDLEEVNILATDYAKNGLVQVINSATGMLGTPNRQDASLTVKTLCQPKILVGQAIELESDILPQYNGQYAVYGVKHEGFISEAVGGDFSSEFNLFLGSQVVGNITIV